jgi:uncharacterized protein with NAD-binding domain and iron-sulfur cluster
LAERVRDHRYQLGWRLGSKGASGRNAAASQRIEEHGLHVWSGFYDNAFRVLRACYDELGRPPGSPLATLDDAFTPQNLVTFTEFLHGAWKNWNVEFPTNPSPVGSDGLLPMVWDCVTMLIGWMAKLFRDSPHSQVDPAQVKRSIVPGRLRRSFQLVESLVLVETARVLSVTMSVEAEQEVPDVPDLAAPANRLLDLPTRSRRTSPAIPQRTRRRSTTG